MIVRVFCLILLGALEPAVTAAQAAEAATPVDAERFAGFESTEEVSEPAAEDPAIFAPLSPISVEAETVKLPADQSIE